MSKLLACFGKGRGLLFMSNVPSLGEWAIYGAYDNFIERLFCYGILHDGMDGW